MHLHDGVANVTYLVVLFGTWNKFGNEKVTFRGMEYGSGRFIRITYFVQNTFFQNSRMLGISLKSYNYI